MTSKTLTIAPEYLSFYIAGSHEVEVPLDMDKRGIVSSEECIKVPCLYWNDGDTLVTVGDVGDVNAASSPAFDGLLATPHGGVLLFDANSPELLRWPVTGMRTRIQIWINHPTEPDEITIAIG